MRNIRLECPPRSRGGSYWRLLLKLPRQRRHGTSELDVYGDHHALSARLAPRSSKNVSYYYHRHIKPPLPRGVSLQAGRPLRLPRPTGGGPGDEGGAVQVMGVSRNPTTVILHLLRFLSSSNMRLMLDGILGGSGGEPGNLAGQVGPTMCTLRRLSGKQLRRQATP